MTFLVLVDPATTPWTADRGALTQVIQSVWTHVEIDSSARGEARAVTWAFETDAGAAEAYLHADGTCLYVDAAWADAVRLAMAFRRMAPETVEVVFCDDIYSFDVHMTHQTTEADLTAAAEKTS